MKKRTKVLALLGCAVTLVAGSVMGTIAYLTSTAEVTNTFSVGNVKITMDEAPVDVYGESTTGERRNTNTYKLIPSHVYTKDPTIHVSGDSEKCYLFVEIDNQLGDDATLYYEYTDENSTLMTEKWVKVEEEDTVSVWAYIADNNDGKAAIVTPASTGTDVKVFGAFKFDDMADPTVYVNDGPDKIAGNTDDVAKKIIVKAYAIQADGLDDLDNDGKWNLLKPQSQG